MQNPSHHWSIDPEIDFLNHGSYGACPIPILAEQQRWRERMEKQPVQFLDRDLEGLLDQAKTVAAPFVGADAEDFVFVPNATTAVNSVLRSLELHPNDEILIVDHGYNACLNVVDHACAKSGAKKVVVELPFPISSPDIVIERVIAAITPATRLALIDHITSPTGLVLPVAQLVHELNERGVDSMIDGAHAPGMLDLDISSLGATYYTGNFHKWVCAPKGAAFLWVHRDRQIELRPMTISHGANSPREDRSRYRLEFDWTGTDDPTAYLCVPAAIEFLGGLFEGGWEELRHRNRQLVMAARKLLCEALGCSIPAPEEMIGMLAAVPLPRIAASSGDSPLYRDPLQDALRKDHGIEVMILSWPSPKLRILRISAQAYNRIEQYEKLAAALRDLV